MKTMTDSKIKQAAFNAINAVFDAGFSEKNVVVEFFDEEAGADEIGAQRARFIEKYGFRDPGVNWIRGDGEAFFARDHVSIEVCKDSSKGVSAGIAEGSYIAGVLIRRFRDHGLTVHTLCHELGHVFCFYNEIDGGDFYGRFCETGSGTYADVVMNGCVNAGYAIWREVVAEVMARACTSGLIAVKLGTAEMQNAIDFYREHMMEDFPNTSAREKYYLAVMCDEIMGTEDVLSGKKWPEIEKKLIGHNTPYLQVVEKVLEGIRNVPMYKITPEFVTEIGKRFINEKTRLLQGAERLGII